MVNRTLVKGYHCVFCDLQIKCGQPISFVVIKFQYCCCCYRHYQIEDNDIDGPYDGIIYAGQEWPDHCNPDVARYRKFYQVCIYVFMYVCGVCIMSICMYGHVCMPDHMYV